jgi:CheY-like chemotaxis protein
MSKGKQLVLVVDDEKNIRLLFEEELTEVGYKIICAENGEEALRLFKDFQPDLVLLDLKMPGIHGVTVLEKIRELDKETPVIVVTAHGAGSSLQKSQAEYTFKKKNLNIVDYITKPVDLDDLVNKVKKTIGPPRIG